MHVAFHKSNQNQIKIKFI